MEIRLFGFQSGIGQFYGILEDKNVFFLHFFSLIPTFSAFGE